ncbi:MAG: FadR family transcriptional regulator [Armatimonadetes bacterium]|nr:FadR family transcriptional regulator [Armatimonadota bacterium]
MYSEDTQTVLPLGYNRDAIGGPSSAIDNTSSYIRTLIHSGELGAAERLPPERELCEHLGVSRVTLRAALTVLQTLGLVVVKRGKKGGTWIVDAPTLQARRAEWVAANRSRFEEMLTFHGIVEREIAALAAMNRTPADLQRLEECSTPPVERATSIQRWYLTFHRTLARAAHNEFLERAMVTVRGEMFIGAPPQGAQPNPRDLAEAHGMILQAVRDQDPDRARQIMAEHHEFLYRLLWETQPDEPDAIAADTDAQEAVG